MPWNWGDDEGLETMTDDEWTRRQPTGATSVYLTLGWSFIVGVLVGWLLHLAIR